MEAKESTKLIDGKGKIMEREDLQIGTDYVARVGGFDPAKHGLIFCGGDTWKMIRKGSNEEKIIVHPATTDRVLRGILNTYHGVAC
jgi:hypothetical protein